MESSTPEIVGREDELAVVESFLDETDAFPGCVLLEGEAGIGKTTLWEAGVRVARQRGYRVLTCNPTVSETRLSFAALRDLLEGVVVDTTSELPAPQRRALAVALLQEDPNGEPPRQGAIAVAFVGTLRRLAKAGPLLVAIDDVQWLDDPSAALLEFGARRVGAEPIAFLLTRRIEQEEPIPLGLERAFDDRLRVLSIGPLSLGALHRLLQTRLGASFSRPVLHKLQEASGGNPFYALELARALEQAGGRVELGEQLPVPGNLKGLLDERIGALGDDTREALAVAAALSEPTIEVIEKALGRAVSECLRAAFEAHVVELDDGRVRFTHPLLAGAAAAGIGERRRRDLHRRLAVVVVDPDSRARHLALSSNRPRRDVAAALDEAAEHARRRGAPGMAAELLEHARRLTPANDLDSWARRSLKAIEAYAAMIDDPRGKAVAREVIERVPRGPHRAAALLHLAWSESSPDLCAEAAAEAGDDAALQARIAYTRALVRGIRGDYAGGLVDARLAAERAEATADPTLIVQALALLGLCEALASTGQPEERLRRAGKLKPTAGTIRAYHAPGTFLARHLLWNDKLDAARRSCDEQLRRAFDEGDEYSHALLSVHLAEIELLAGNWSRANELVDQADGGELPDPGILSYARALVEAHRGRVESARLHAEEGLAAAEAASRRVWATKLRAVLGFIELSLGSPKAALEWLEPINGELQSMGVVEPGVVLFASDEIEALIGAGLLPEAEARLTAFARRGRQLDRPWILSTAGRCHGLLLAAKGDLSGALHVVERALVDHERLPMPFERGRTLLVLGQVQRRAAQRRAARGSLQQALSIFETLGAPLWAEKARAELARIGGRAPGGVGLTPTEGRVAELVARGLSNKEVAVELVVSVRAVEANLTRVYAKLGIGSRSQLARHLAEQAVEQPHT